MKWLPSILMVLGGVLLLIPGGNIAPGPSPLPSSDDVSKAFDVYESLWRKAQGELAARLESKQITSESAATEWFGKTNTEARRLAFEDLLKKESAEFGGEKWTAEKHAKTIRGYVR